MNYTEISVWCPLERAEDVASLLVSAGYPGAVVSELLTADPTPREVAVKVYHPGEMPSSALGDLEYTLGAMASSFREAPYGIETRAVDPEDWAHAWKRHWHVQHVGERLVIQPSWEPYDPAPGEIVMALDPNQAFGTGTHPTTRLCLLALERGAAGTVFDVGTGSGILAIAAVLLGATRVEACDMDPIAVDAAVENAQANGVGDRVHVRIGGIETLEGTCDVLVVNILAEIVAEMAPAIAARLKPGGRVLASGIVRDRAALVRAAFAHAGLGVIREEELDGWVLVEATPR